jgi:hypothetical protein
MQTLGVPWKPAVRVAIPVAAVGLLLLIRPEIVRGTFSSTESVLRVALVVAAWVGFSFLLRRFVPNPWVRTGVTSVAGAALLWVTVAPYFQTETVDEAFPVVAGPTTPTQPAQPATTLAGPAESPAAPTTTVAPAPAGPVKVTTGQLRGLAGHRGSGEAAVWRQPDGSLLVRLEDFSVSNAPALVLYLVPGADRDRIEGGVRLGGLRGNQGSQNFTLPAGTPVGGEQTLLIWCDTFAVPVAGATQAAA